MRTQRLKSAEINDEIVSVAILSLVDIKYDSFLKSKTYIFAAGDNIFDKVMHICNDFEKKTTLTFS